MKLANLKRRSKNIEEKIQEIITEVSSKVNSFKTKEKKEHKTISTGSTLLDLTISGSRRQEGGIPGGIILEVAGPASSGKTAILASIAANAQSKGGQVMFLDPEARFDQEYAEIYGIKLDKEDYYQPDTVEKTFDMIYNWQPKNEKVINVITADSLAALSTEIEMTDRDKMGMRRAKSFSEGLRKTARIISKNNWLIACSNQLRDGLYGNITPGGQAIKYYCSLRMNIRQIEKIKKEKMFHEKKISKILGIESRCTITKSTIDSPHRECNVSIIFGYGLDTIRDELNFYKTTLGETTFNCFDKNYQSIDKAITYIEQNNLQEKLKERTIDLWNEIEKLFIHSRKKYE